MNILYLIGKWKERTVILIALAIFLLVVLTVMVYDHRVQSEHMNEGTYYYEKSHEKMFSSFYLQNEQITSVYSQLLLNRNVTNWLNNPTELIQDMYQLSEIQSAFIQLINSHPALDSIYLHNKSNNMVLSTHYMLSELTQFPRKRVFEQLYEANSASVWVPIAQAPSAGSVSDVKVIAWTAGVPSRSSKGAISINLNSQFIMDHVMNENAHLLWLDGNNDVLLAQNEDTLRFFQENKEYLTTNKQTSHIFKEHLIITSESENGNWKLFTILPSQLLMKDGPSRQVYKYAIFLLFVTMSALLFLYFRFIRKEQDKQYGMKVQSSLDDARRSLVADLLSGKPIPPDLFEKAREYEINLEAEGYQVVVFHIDDYYNYLLTKNNQEKFFMNKIIYNAIRWTFSLKFNAYMINTEMEKITVLVCFDDVKDSESEKLLETIQYIQNDVKENFALTVCVGVSEIADEIAYVHSCYGHAMHAVSYKAVYGKQSIIYYEQLAEAKSASTFQYTKEIHKLTDDLRTGQLDRIERSLDRILEELISSEHFTLDWIHAIFANLMASIMKYTIEHRIDLQAHSGEDVFLTLYSYEFLEEKKAYILKICRAIMELQQSTPSESNSTASAITEYIDKHFDQPISLSIVADELSMSPSYLSVVIKNHLGIGFVDYINKLRIQKSIVLLEDPNRTIAKIAESCGYDTVHTFIRHFKKVHHMPPNEYRIKKRRENI